MKKKTIVLFLLLMLMGCSNKVKTTEETQEINLNHEELMEGNFSSIAGEYVNLKGESIFINDEGYQSDEVIGHEVYYNGSVYFRNISSKLDGYGVQMTVYPVGEEVMGYPLGASQYEIIPSDITKIRITYGHADPMSDDEIYTKK